jgi:hypothetical protein
VAEARKRRVQDRNDPATSVITRTFWRSIHRGEFTAAAMPLTIKKTQENCALFNACTRSMWYNFQWLIGQLKRLKEAVPP